MTSSENTFSNRPFENLDRLLKRKTESSLPLRRLSKPKPALCGDACSVHKSDRELFLDAVRNLRPLRKKHRSVASIRPRLNKNASMLSEMLEPCQSLKRLVTSGEGFDISQTPEYMEGIGHQVPGAVTQDLHRGRFAMQAYIDLHGMDAPGATDALERFFQRSTSNGLRSVLIIHGRGLSSPGEPVLKTRLQQLLTSNRWRRWILAFSSARSCDGGAGATYVLLRKRPLSRKLCKQPANLKK